MSTSDDVNPDLVKERKAASFSTSLMTNILDGGAQKTNRRRYIEHVFHSDEEFQSPDAYFLSRQENLLEATRKSVAFTKKIRQLGLTDSEDIGMATVAAIKDGRGPLSMHFVAFLPPLQLLGDEEQQKYWIPRATNFEVIGCYAQTELAHGSNVRGLLTRADYDVATKEFVLNTPCVEATKWWAGSLGMAANHAMVMAQLHTNGKNHGLHPFIVPIRDMKTHKPLPGIEVGDHGPKFGFDTVDNGFLNMTNIRIPRDNLLRRSGQVLDDGTYVKPHNAKLVYGGMLGIRANLPRMAAVNLARAVTVAIRYSCVRRQSELRPGEPEPQVLDFQTQQHKLLPLLASAYAYTFTGQWMVALHKSVGEEMAKGDFSRLPEDHISAAGLKALINWKVHEAIEVCRLSCGGHGYSHASGLPSLYANHVANSTAEGETTVLLLQTGKYLGKCYMDLQQGKTLAPTIRYLANKSYQPLNTATIAKGCDLRQLLAAFQYRSIKTLEAAGHKIQKVMMDSGDQHEAINSNLVALTEVAKAHTEVLILTAFVERVESVERDSPREGAVLRRLCELYGVTEVLAHAHVYLQHGQLSPEAVPRLQDRLFSLYSSVRRDAVALVDAFDFTDRTLDSILGRADGVVYENLYKWAKESPLNTQEVHESFRKYLEPLKQQSKL